MKQYILAAGLLITVFIPDLRGDNTQQANLYQNKGNNPSNRRICVKKGYDETLADAIFKAEGGSKTRHPYGILAHYKHTTPRQACLNTIASARRRFAKQTKETDFIHFLSLTYCPIGASNDPTGLNRNWEKNVRKFMKGK